MVDNCADVQARKSHPYGTGVYPSAACRLTTVSLLNEIPPTEAVGPGNRATQILHLY